MSTVLLYALMVLSTGYLQGDSAAPIKADPMFSRYPVEVRFHGTPARPLHNTSNSKFYRTKIREQEGKVPNFADHYTIAIWGCGSCCEAFSIVDADNGRVYDFSASVSWFDEKDGGIDFRRNSRAIHVVGSLNEGNNSADRWYMWDGMKLKLISEKPAQHVERGPQDQN